MVRMGVLLVLAACGTPVTSDDKMLETADTATATITTPTGTTTTEPTGPNPWKVEGQQGSVVAVFHHFGPAEPQGFDVHATFAKVLPDVDDAAWCLAGGPCSNGTPALDSYVSMFAFPPVDDTEFSWVGNEVEVWRVDLPFTNAPLGGFAFYSEGVASRPEESLVKLKLPDEGEWGAFNEDVVPVAPAMQVLKPAPGDRVDLSGDVLEFEWVSGGEGEVFLTIMGERSPSDPINVMYKLGDDGAHTLDLIEHGLTPESDVQIRIGRRVHSEAEINGNTVFLTGIDEQPFAPVCLPWPDVGLGGDESEPSGNTIDPFYVSLKFQGTISGGEIHDYTPEGEDEPRSARVIFTFADYFFDPLCRVVYDVSGMRAEQVAPWPRYGGGGVVYDAYMLNLRDGYTECGPVNVLTFGSADLRDWLDLFTWGIGIGDRVEVPHSGTLSGYITFDGVDGIEMNPAYGYALHDCDTAIKSAGMLPPADPLAPPTSAYWEHPEYYWLGIQ
jgi:hypothetical protein